MKGFVFILITMLIIFLILRKDHIQRSIFSEVPNGLDSDVSEAWDQRVNTSKKRPAFVVGRTDWVRFPLPPNVRKVRLFSNASLPADTDLVEVEDLRYALDIQVLSLMKTVLQTKRHHVRSRVPLYVDAVSSDPYTGNFFHPREGLVPAGGKAIHLDLGSVDGASSIRLRLVSVDPLIRDVVVRVSSQQSVSERELRYQWNRLNEEKRKQLAESTLFGSPRLLSQAERQALVSQPWVPIGPSGIENRNYVQRDIYSARRDENQKEYHLNEDNEQLIVSPQRRVTIPVREGGATFSVMASLLEPLKGTEALEVTYFDSVTLQQQSREIKLPEEIHEFEESPSNRGLIEIRSNNARAEISVFELGEEVTPKPTLIRSVDLSLTSETRFLIYPQEHSASNYRLDLRGLLTGEPLAGASVTYKLIDQDGHTLETADLIIDETPSLFDGLADLPGQATLTQAKRYYLQPNAKAGQLVLSSGFPIVANLYTRPVGKRITQRIPQDYVRTDESQSEKQRIWFPIRAHDLESDQLRQLALQSQPSESRVGPDEDYQWTDFVPAGRWSAHTLLTPRSIESPLREEAYLSVFVPIPLRQSFATNWLAPFGRQSLRPKLLYLGKLSLIEPTIARIQVDNQPAFSFPLTASRGEISLPEVPAGAGRLRVELPEGFRTYVNYHGIGEGSLLKREVIRLEQKQSLAFAYEKVSDGEESLTGRFYTRTGTKDDTVLLVDLAPPGERRSAYALKEHSTITQRRMIISPVRDGAVVPALNAGLQEFTEGQRFVLPVGSDLSAGLIPLTITHVEGPPGYVQLTRINPGLARSVYVFREEME